MGVRLVAHGSLSESSRGTQSCAIHRWRSLVEFPKTKFDPAVAQAAIDELRPICRKVYALYTWDEMNPFEIAAYLARQGVRRDANEVMEYVFSATRHIQRRLAESELHHCLSGEQSALSGLQRPEVISLHNASSYIWVDAPSSVSVKH